MADNKTNETEEIGAMNEIDLGKVAELKNERMLLWL